MSSRFATLEQFSRNYQATNLRGATLNRSMTGSARSGIEKRAMAEPNVFERFPHLRRLLQDGTVANTILMMIDLSPFSEVVKEMSPTDIAGFLDGYYDLVVKQVNAEQGVVEKYIGDAVIAAFGQPFENSTSSNRFRRVHLLARDLVKTVKAKFAGEVTAKVALAVGPCFFGYVGPQEHEELTIVGNPLTQLFRLESACPPSSVVIAKELYDTHCAQSIPVYHPGQPEYKHVKWFITNQKIQLRGVGEMVLTIEEYRG